MLCFVFEARRGSHSASDGREAREGLAVREGAEMKSGLQLGQECFGVPRLRSSCRIRKSSEQFSSYSVMANIDVQAAVVRSIVLTGSVAGSRFIITSCQYRDQEGLML